MFAQQNILQALTQPVNKQHQHTDVAQSDVIKSPYGETSK
jgi:hypothetical protein